MSEVRREKVQKGKGIEHSMRARLFHVEQWGPIFHKSRGLVNPLDLDHVFILVRISSAKAPDEDTEQDTDAERSPKVMTRACISHTIGKRSSHCFATVWP